MPTRASKGLRRRACVSSYSNRTRTTWPDGYFIDRTFDQLNRLTDIKLNGSGTSSLHFNYDALSRRSDITYGASVSSTSYSLGAANSVAALSQRWLGSSVAFSYAYDDQGRLVGQSTSDTQYSWHTVTGGTFSYGTANNLNQYPTVGGVTQTYNSNGCLTSDGTWAFSYDAENRLTAASKAGVSASYLYDPSNRQGQKNVGGVKTRYIYDGWQRIADYDSTTGTLQNRFVYGTSLDEPLIQVSAAGVVSYFHQDRSSNVIATSDSTGTVTNRYKYSPYGESSSLTGTTFGYQGQRFDSETGLYYMKHRYYSPSTGRFLQPDPIGYSDNFNLYQFVQNDPNSFSDPLGLGSIEGGPLFVIPAVDGLGYNNETLAGNANLVAHVQVWFSDGTGIGYFQDGKLHTSKEVGFDHAKFHPISPEVANLNDYILHQAVDNTPPLPEYLPITANCQSWALEVYKEYLRLLGKPSSLLLSGSLVIDGGPGIGGTGGGGGGGLPVTPSETPPPPPPGNTPTTVVPSPSSTRDVNGKVTTETVTGQLVPPKELPSPETGKLGDPKYKNPKGAFGSKRS